MELYQVSAEDIKNDLINLHQIVFEVTDACNLQCDYCIYSGMYEGFDKRSNTKLPFARAKRILDYLLDLWNRNKDFTSFKPTFVGFYGGEPLLNMPLVKEIIGYIEEKAGDNRKFIYTMTSNALVLDKHMDYLAEKNIVLLISLDGDEEADSYRKTVTQESSFRRVFANIIRLKEKYPDYFERCVNFNSVLTNKTSLDGIYEFFMKHFGKVPNIAQLNNSNVKESSKQRFCSMFQGKNESLLKSPDKKTLDTNLFLSSPGTGRLVNYIFHHSDNVYYTYNDLFVNKDKAKVVPTGTCIPFEKKLFVTVNGKILQCEKISHEYVLGSVTDKTLTLDLQEIADKFNKWIADFANRCAHCYVNKMCPQCVFQIDSMREGKASCPAYYTQDKYVTYVKENLDYLKENPALYERILKEVALY